jgi:hypothetical protein
VLVVLVPSTCVFLVVGIHVAVGSRQHRLQERREFETIRELMS